MNIKILDESQNSMRFVLSDSDTGMANAIRRILHGELPILSIDEVDMVDNNSGLFDETLGHRLGLIPLVFDSKMYKTRKEGDAESSQNQVVFVLEKEGPCIVKAGDMKSTDEEVRVGEPDIPIVELLEGQKVKFEATARLGLGSENARFQGAIVGYSNLFNVKLDKDSKIKIDDIDANDIIEKKGSTIKVAMQDGNAIYAKLFKLREQGKAEISPDETAFIFKVESASGMQPAKLLELALEKIENDADEFIKEAKKVLK